MKVTPEKLQRLIANKMHRAGLNKQHAEMAAEALTFADLRGIHSHGAVRVEYYSERIAKGGITCEPKFTFKKTGPASAVFDGDNGCGLVAARLAMDEAVNMARESGVALVGVRRISHSGALAYFVERAAAQGMIALSVCQSDPMAVPYGGAREFFGTNPIAFGAPTADKRLLTFDMATTVQAWGKILYARSRGEAIPDSWAVDVEGNPTTDPHKVNALLPIAGPKGYGLMMMVDVLSGVLLGVPFGQHVSSMYADLSKGRDLGQLHIVIDPGYFTDRDAFCRNMSQMLDELAAAPTAPGVDKIYYPGERGLLRQARYEKEGIEIVDEIYRYLVSDDIHFNRYDHKNKFAE